MANDCCVLSGAVLAENSFDKFVPSTNISPDVKIKKPRPLQLGTSCLVPSSMKVISLANCKRSFNNTFNLTVVSFMLKVLLLFNFSKVVKLTKFLTSRVVVMAENIYFIQLEPSRFVSRKAVISLK